MSTAIIKNVGGEVVENVAEAGVKSAAKTTIGTFLERNIKTIALATGITGGATVLLVKPDLIGNLLSNTAKTAGSAIGSGIQAAAPGVSEGINSIIKPAAEAGGNLLGTGFSAVLTGIFSQFGLTKQQGLMLIYVIIAIILIGWIINILK